MARTSTFVSNKTRPETKLSVTPPPRPKAPTTEEWHLKHVREIRKKYNDTQDLFKPAHHILKFCVKAQDYGEYKMARLDCEITIWRYFRHLLDKKFYVAAAILMWGEELFNPNPHCTKLVWHALENHAKNLIQGGGSLSKSYSGAVLYALYYLHDPEWTSIKVISVTGEHNKRNIFAHLKNFLNNTIVQIVDRKVATEHIPNLRVNSESVQANDDDKQGIHMVTIPGGDDGKGRLRGFHPVPRTGGAHKIFGVLSRVMAFLDEAEEIPGGVWEDINNILLTEEAEASNVKVTAATNPKDRSSKFGEYAEPSDGWASLDIETSESWESARGWHVTRLDAAKCENVIQGKVVYPGLQTKEGFENLLKLGQSNPEYFTMGRGWFPEASMSSVIINESLFDSAKGLYHFVGPTVPWGGVDLAFEGNDHVWFTAGKEGLADQWTDMRGKVHRFTSARTCLQVDSQIMMAKERTIELAKSIMRMAKDMGVKPPWLGVDRTGNGTGVHDSLVTMFGPEVLGLMYSWAATDMKILDDDTKVANEVYHDISSEMAFSLRRFMETDTIKLHPGINWNDLEKEVTSRRYTQIGRGFVRIESKKDFKKRMSQRSPDRFDSLCIGVHAVRTNGVLFAQQVAPPLARKRVSSGFDQSTSGIVDSLDFLDISDDNERSR